MNTLSLQQQIQLTTGLERLSAMIRSQAWREGTDTSLHPAQRALLATLASAGESFRAGELAARLGVSAASISDSLRAVEAKGWVTRMPDPDDARARLLSLTTAGESLIAGLQQDHRGLASLVAILTDEDAAALLRILQLLIRQAQEQGLASGLRTCLGCAFFRPFANTGTDADSHPDKPHFCAYVGAPFGNAELRIDCAEQQPQDAAILANDVLRFRDGPMS